MVFVARCAEISITNEGSESRVAGMGRSCDLASRSHDTKASVVQDPKVSGHYFIFQHRAGRNIDSVSMVGYNDDRSLPKQRNNQTVQQPAKTCRIIIFHIFLALTFRETCFPKVTSPDTVK